MKSLWLKRILSSPLFLIIFLAIAGLIISNFIKEFLYDYQVRQEIKRLQAEAQQLEKQNQNLAQILKNNEEIVFLEREARIRFGLQYPGENLTVIPQAENNSLDIKNSQSRISKSKTNLYKWWEYFFSPQ